MGRGINWLSNFFEKFLLFCSVGVILGCAAMITITTATRTIIGYDFGFMQELPTVFLPVTIFLMSGVLLKWQKHIRVDLVENWFRGKVAIVVRIVINLSVIGFGAMLLYAMTH